MARQVTLEEATAKANQMGLMFMETSAKAGHNVKSLFKKIAMSLPGMEKETQGDGNTSMSLQVSGYGLRLNARSRNRCHDTSDERSSQCVNM